MRKIVIFGSGVTGLKLAHELIKTGNEITVYETKDQPGGKCIGTFENGLPTELTHRQMFASNMNFITTLNEIEYEGNNLLKNIEPINNVQFYWAKERKFMDFNRNFFNFLEQLIDNLKSANSLFFSGVPLKDIYWFRSKLLVNKIDKETLNMPLREYLEFDKRPKLAVFILKIISTWIGGNGNTKTGDFLLLFNYKNLSKKKVYTQTNTTSITLNGPISDSLIQPWYDFLRKKGVTFHFNEGIKKLNISNGKALNAVSEKNNIIEADAFVLAIPPKQVIEMLPKIAERLSVSYIKSHGFQFHFKEVPDLFLNKTIGIIADSAWGLSYKLYHTKKYAHKEFSNGVKVTISITATKTEKERGPLYKKPLIECTIKEVEEELLFQMGLLKKDMCKDMMYGNLNIGLGAKYLEYTEINLEEYKDWHHGPIIKEDNGNKYFWAFENELINPDYNNKVGINSFNCNNVFISGEWINDENQVWTVPSTIERCMENAAICSKIVNNYLVEA
ncbi:FAD-dependent oxidoreductase [Flavobacterium columnare]|uniref:FAD-dependent oxidoreductase n=1 Tax=Flavobacterium columnare TaxID=996 RepID=UPI002D2045F5|nr:FAD-dependent oxidoreductase [Flavobacterium columnare]MEB3800670.1 FAD-dependent oxidoreductase [Flavobacterium columnare]